SADLIASAVLDTLHIIPGDGEPSHVRLLDYLRDKELLLVLDNFEHLLDGVGLLAGIMAAAPQVKLLVTARERLNLPGELSFELPGLPFPNNLESADLESYSAVQLFLQNARRAAPHFALSAHDRPFVAQICQLVEGMPLGIELAAAWAPLFSCREIAAEIA